MASPETRDDLIRLIRDIRLAKERWKMKLSPRDSAEAFDRMTEKLEELLSEDVLTFIDRHPEKAIREVSWSPKTVGEARRSVARGRATVSKLVELTREARKGADRASSQAGATKEQVDRAVGHYLECRTKLEEARAKLSLREAQLRALGSSASESDKMAASS